MNGFEKIKLEIERKEYVKKREIDTILIKEDREKGEIHTPWEILLTFFSTTNIRIGEEVQGIKLDLKTRISFERFNWEIYEIDLVHKEDTFEIVYEIEDIMNNTYWKKTGELRLVRIVKEEGKFDLLEIRDTLTMKNLLKIWYNWQNEVFVLEMQGDELGSQIHVFPY